MPTRSTTTAAVCRRWAPCLGIVAVIAASPAAATTSLARELNAYASIMTYTGTLSGPPGFSLLDGDDGFGFAKNAGLLGGDILALASLGSGTVTSSAKGEWTSDEAGTVVLDWGWRVNATSGVSVSAAAPLAWTYRFIASDDGVFNISGAATFSGDPVGLNAIALTGSGSGLFGDAAADAGGSGSFSIPIFAGQTYQFSLENRGGRFRDRGLVATGAGQATFAWNITYGPAAAAVPEPGTWALMILGFGLSGATLRQRRRDARA